jgi:hypothetical protein
MKTFLRVLSLLSVAALLAVSGCKKPASSDICVDFVAKLAQCQGVGPNDPRVAEAVAQCRADRKAEGDEDADRLARDDAKARQFIEAPCQE